MSWIYLAMPTDKNSDVHQDYDRVIGALRGAGLTDSLFVPVRAYDIKALGFDRVDYMVTVNRTALEEADVMLIVYQPGLESWGVPIEMLMAREARVPVFVLVDPHISLPPGFEFPVYLRFFANRVFFSIETLLAELVTILPRSPQETSHVIV